MLVGWIWMVERYRTWWDEKVHDFEDGYPRVNVMKQL